MYTVSGVHLRKSELRRVICVLIERQRTLLASPNPLKRFGVLWIAVTLDKCLRQCANHEIGQLLSVVQDRFHILEPEFALCHHAKRRLLLRP